MGQTAAARSSGKSSAAAAFGLLALALLAQGEAGAESEVGARTMFSATVGGVTEGTPRVLLRWSEMERPPAYSKFLIKRRAASAAAFTDLVTVEPFTDANDVQDVFTAEGNEAILADITSLLGLTYATELLALRGDPDPVDAMQYELLLDTNYGAAIAHGVAYLDTSVALDVRYAYELWGLDESNIPVERLGKLWANAGANTSLPPPQALTVVAVDEDVDMDGRIDKGMFGDGKIYLRWEPKPGLEAADRETQPAGFGFDVFREPKGAGPCSALPDGGAWKVNGLPVIPLPSTDPGRIPDFFFVDDNTNTAVPPITKGTRHCYWLVARDLLLQLGRPSAPVEACIPDLARPRQVRDVKTQILPAGIQISWTPNADDPVTLEGGTRYIDDTVGYNVYRFTDFSELLDPPDPLRLVPECTALPATASGCTDTAADVVVGRIYWYTVTAVDTPVCLRPANESPYSAPTRGVIYDQDPPSIGQVGFFCNPAVPPSIPRRPPCIRNCINCPGTSCTADDPLAIPWCHAGGASGIWPLPGDDWGYTVPLAGMDPDTMSARLYRGATCGLDDPNDVRFRPVEEAFRENAADTVLDLHEPFGARIAQKLEYRLRPLDRDSNVGGVAIPADGDGGPMPAFVPGQLNGLPAPPPRPTLIETSFDPGAGTLQVRWHAPGAEALAGFVLHVGPAGDPAAGDFHLLPNETTYPAFGNYLASEKSADEDVDGDGLKSGRVIIIREQTKCLGDLGPNLGGLRAADGYLEYTIPAFLGFGGGIEVYAVDFAGQLSLPAALARLSPDVDPSRLDWPQRDLPPVSALVSQFVAPDHVDLCWDQGTLGRCTGTREICDDDADCPDAACEQAAGRCSVSDAVCNVDADCGGGGETCTPMDPAPYVAVFRTRVEGRCSGNGAVCDDEGECPGPPTCILRVDSYQQRSPLVRIRAYIPSPLSQCHCADGMVSPACWQDFGIAPGTTYKYTVLRFWGAPHPTANDRSDRGHRSEGEMEAVFGPDTVAVP